MLSLYQHRNSPLHRSPAGWKLAGLAVVATGAFFVTSPPLLAGGIAAALGLAALARLPWRALAAAFRPLLPMLVLLFVAQGLFAGWLEGTVVIARILLLVLLATLVTLTTPMTAMVDALERGLAVLRPLGIDPAKVGLMLALTLRLIPMMLDQAREIRDAQRARGVEGTAWTLLVPLVMKTLRMADALSDALDARGYDPVPEPAPPRPPAAKGKRNHHA